MFVSLKCVNWFVQVWTDHDNIGYATRSSARERTKPML